MKIITIGYFLQRAGGRQLRHVLLTGPKLRVTLHVPLLQRYRVESYATDPQHSTSPAGWHVADPTEKEVTRLLHGD